MIASVKSVKSVKGASFYELGSACGEIKMLSVLSDEALERGDRVRLGVKSSDVVIAVSRVCDISISNCLECEIKELYVGDILATVTLRLSDESLLESIITANSAKVLNLKEKMRVYALLKATSFFIKEKF